jgi:phospholipid/cholesterol/gamma-HCH transport system substrate-binding protein
MKYFSERNPVIVGAIGIALTAGVVVAALQYDKLPFINQNRDYSAYFAEAGGLTSGDTVRVSGLDVGEVSSVELEGPRVLVKFNVVKDVWLGDRTEAAIKTKSLLGAKTLEVTPRGQDEQSGPIPVERTRPPYHLPDALGDLTTAISGLNTDQLSDSLKVLADTFAGTPPQFKIAVEGVGRFSETLDKRDAQLRDLLADGRKAAGVLGARSDQIVSLVANANALLAQLEGQSRSLDQIANNISAVAQQLKGFVADNRSTLKPAIDKLNVVLTIVDNRKERVQESIKKLNSYAMSLGESVSSGPFFRAYLVNLLPGQFVQPFVDAAFSDLGLDPNVLLPSERTDPPLGQPGTPALPVPYPRTGQGGDPHLTLPDAITGNPGDPRYPYREPIPAPPPGGPPPGPPAEAPPGLQSTPSPTPTPVYVTDPTAPPSPAEAAQQ